MASSVERGDPRTRAEARMRKGPLRWQQPLRATCINTFGSVASPASPRYSKRSRGRRGWNRA